MTGAPSGPRWALGAGGGLVLLVALVDLFVTIFAYDGFTFLTPRMHRLMWAAMRTATAWLPRDARRTVLSLGSALLLPATLGLWLALEVTGFALMFMPGLAGGAFRVSHHAGRGAVSAFYLSGGDLTSLTFGDLVPLTPLYRSMVDLETVVGLSTFTLALTYVLSAFDARAKLDSLYARVRRNAIEPHRPSTIIERRYRHGDASYLSDFLQSVVEELDAYNEGLRRFPVAFYFHTRRIERATPRILSALGRLIELSRWGLPPSEPLTTDPNLLALVDEYTSVLSRLRRSFLGRLPAPAAPVPSPDQFAVAVHQPGTEAMAFAELQVEAMRASGLDFDGVQQASYERFCEWLQFHRSTTAVVGRLQSALGYG
ncbi:MAG: potassium channel family protein [Actinomycetota bacterium]|nr:potassium channel family protein [Actinomycetota bacterium]